MVRNLIKIALSVLLLISCEKQDTNIQIQTSRIKPSSVGILDQLMKDVKDKSPSSSKDAYITTCIDDRPEVLISGPITNPNSFVDGSNRIDLDFFSYEGKNYVMLRAENDLPYGLPGEYDRFHYVRNSSSELGVYYQDGVGNTTISGSFDFLFDVEDLQYLYEIDENYNVIGAKKALSTVSINCETYNGWYSAGADTIDWSQGVYDEYSQISDSIYIKLNAKGDYVSGGYLYENSFFLENNYCNGCIDVNANDCELSETDVEGKTKQTQYGSYDTDEDGILEYYYCVLDDQYEISGYKMAANGNTVDFIWYPNGTNSVSYIGEVVLNKTSEAPNEDKLDAAKESYESQTFVERHGSWYQYSEESYNRNSFDFPKYMYLTEDSIYGYALEDVLLDTYSEIYATDREITSVNLWNENRIFDFNFNNSTCTDYVRAHVRGDINDTTIEFGFHNANGGDECSYDNEGAYSARAWYTPIEDPNITIN